MQKYCSQTVGQYNKSDYTLKIIYVFNKIVTIFCYF